MTPFDITVASSLDLYKPVNAGPRIDELVDSISLEPGLVKTISVGKVIDFE